MAQIAGWLKNHSLLYTFILFLISAAFSIYSKDIRRFLHEWPRAKEKKRQVQRKAVSRRLELLELLHNNSYELILYIADKVVLMVYGLIFFFVIVGASKTLHKWATLAAVLSGILSGEFIGALQEMHEIFGQLKSYEQSVATLQLTLSVLEKEA